MLKHLLAATTIAIVSSAGYAAEQPNTLTPAEKAAGWKLLFDGKTAAGWRGYKQDKFPAKGWMVEDGALKVVAQGGGGDIITTDQYGDFELELEFKTTPKANSGIIWRVTEKHDTPWMTGPEFQVIDDAGAGLKPDDPHSSGALYDLAPPTPTVGGESVPDKALKPAGEYNTARIVIKNNRVRHYLNGIKVVDVPISGDDWTKRIAGSKFKVYDGFGVQPKGHIALQDHGDSVFYRNIKIRDLSAPMPGEVELFNGTDTTGWDAFVPELSAKSLPPMSVWSVKDGVLICSGNPGGYIHTTKDYSNFVLKLEWRFDPTKGGGNSGVLIRKTGPDKVWPKSIEAQLQSENAGDFWNIENVVMTTDKARTNGRNTKKTHGNEYPIGEWNEYEVIADHGTIILKVNGEELNRATQAAEDAGPICLQSEGKEIHFRSIRISEIK
jgi:hypothetical protein